MKAWVPFVALLLMIWGADVSRMRDVEVVVWCVAVVCLTALTCVVHVWAEDDE